MSNDLADTPQPDFRLLFESGPGAYLVLDPELTIVAATDAFLRITRTTRAHVVGRSVLSVLPDDPADPASKSVHSLRASFARVLATRQPDTIPVQRFEMRGPTGAIETRYWSPVNTPIVDADGAVRFVVHRIEDVTDFVRLEQVGTEKDRLADALRTHAGEMEDEIGRRMRELEAANRELSALNGFLDSLIENIPHVIFVKDGEHHRYDRINRAAEALTGISRFEMLGKTDFECFPFEQAARFRAMDVAVLEGSAPVEILEEPIETPRGVRWLATKKIPIVSDGGRRRYLLGISEDITEKREMQHALRRMNEELERRIEARTLELVETNARLRRSEERFRLLVESVRDYAIVVIDPDGRVATWNSGAERIHGYRADEILGRHFGVFHTAEDLAAGAPASALTIARERGRIEDEGWRVRKDGTAIWANVVTTPVRGAAGELLGFAQVTRDLTERRTLEEQLRQAQRMDAIGRLAGGIAHDFNNLLSVIITCGDFMRSELSPDAGMRADVDQILQAASRAAELTQQLLAFSRRQVLAPRVIDLNEVIARTEKMLRRVIGEDIDLRIALGAGLGKVSVDPGQIEQVIMNLVVNARDAMPRGGTLTIETADVVLDEGCGECQSEATAGRHVMLAVTDTGCGIAREIRSRIFEPFFTTKEPGKGTGLGLATVFGIVKQSGGNVCVESEPGRGASFKVYLPRVADARRNEPKSSRPPRASRPPRGACPPGGERILLVEDDGPLRALARKVLAKCGYEILDACDAHEALRIASAFKGRIDLLLTDVVMPKMSGRELAQLLTERRPHLKTLFMSGYTDDAVVHHGVLEESVAFLQKPIVPAQLERKVREVLDGHGAGGSVISIPCVTNE